MSEPQRDPLAHTSPPPASVGPREETRDEEVLEAALAKEHVSAIQTTPFKAISPDMPVHEVLELMVKLEVACLLVADNDRLLGLFSDWDVVDKVALYYDKVKDLPIREVMTGDPVHVHEGDSAAAALCVIALEGFRHVPVLGTDDRIVGIVSPQRVATFLQKHLDEFV